MESNNTADDEAIHWQDVIVFAARPSGATRSHWEPVVLATVCFLHAAVIAYVFFWQKDFVRSGYIDNAALQVNFIERISIPDKKPFSSSASSKRKMATTKSDMSSEVEKDESAHAEEIIVPEHQSLRLTMDVDEWKLAPAVAPRDPLKRQHIAIPGRAEPFVRGIKLTDKLTPEQRLKMVGRLFGAVDYDPCKEARNRMASGQSQVDAIDLEYDLRSIERHCRP